MKCAKDSHGTKRWYLNNKLHRDDGPAIEYKSGTNEWYLNGKLHRVNGPAVEYATGTRVWYLNNKLHRVDGPAIEWVDGMNAWYINDERHRIDGPAIEHLNGQKMWYLNGKRIDESNYYSLLKIRRIRSNIIASSKALGFNFTNMLNLSRNRTTIEWYYSPANGGGRLAKKKIEYVISV